MSRTALAGIKLPQVFVVAAVVLIIILQSIFFSNKYLVNNIQNSQSIDLQQYHFDNPITNTDTGTGTGTDTDTDNDTKTYIDPEATDCSEILTTFLKKQIQVAKNHDDIDYRRSFVAISDSENKDIQPFYVATHDKKIDSVREIIFNKHFYYEQELTKVIANYFQTKKVNGQKSIMIDVGANIGWFSLVAAAHGASRVYSFEPNLQNTIRLCESLSLNHWLKEDRSQDVVIPISKGLGDEEDQKQMYAVDEFNPGSFTFSKGHAKRFPLKDEDGNLIYNKNGQKMVDYKVIDTLSITTLDLFAERHGWFHNDDDSGTKKSLIGIMKIDVEHFELEVLEGAKELLQSQMIEIITFELKTNEPRDRKSRIVQILFEAGYRLHMHGTWQGPKHIVTKVYENWEDLAADFDLEKEGKSLYGENVLFKLSTSNSSMVDHDTEVVGDNNDVDDKNGEDNNDEQRRNEDVDQNSNQEDNIDEEDDNMEEEENNYNDDEEENNDNLEQR
jgi:FkbM family methyltransferase